MNEVQLRSTFNFAMLRYTTLLLWFGFYCNYAFGQEPIDVAETTLKIAALGEEVFYYGFAEGDKMILNFREVKGKELKEFEIIELPSSSKFMDYKTKKIENKVLTITRTGIYKFRLSNSAITGRICQLKIQRIPASEATKNFNTSVYWKTTYDTTYTIEQEKYLIRADTSVVNLTDQVAKVHSQGNLNGNKTTVSFTLPPNTVAWSYYIGVDQDGQKAFDAAAKQLSRFAGPIVSKIPGYGPLASLALGGTSYISSIQSGEDIDYFITDELNMGLFMKGQPINSIKKGKVVNDFSRMLNPRRGEYFVCLYNDNMITGVMVTVKITAIAVAEQWGKRDIKRMQVKSAEMPYLKN
jgi:hypothetical protein